MLGSRMSNVWGGYCSESSFQLPGRACLTLGHRCVFVRGFAFCMISASAQIPETWIPELEQACPKFWGVRSNRCPKFRAVGHAQNPGRWLCAKFEASGVPEIWASNVAQTSEQWPAQNLSTSLLGQAWEASSGANRLLCTSDNF